MPEIFRLFLARKQDGIVGVRIIKSHQHDGLDYLGDTPVHGKRSTVHPDHRGEGIGKQILDAGKRFVFEELDLRALFGQTGEAGAAGCTAARARCTSWRPSKGRRTNGLLEQHLRFFRES